MEEDAPPVYTKKKLPDVTKSFHNFMVKVRYMIFCINSHLLKNLTISLVVVAGGEQLPVDLSVYMLSESINI